MKQMFSKEELQAVSKEVADTEIDENLIANPTLEGDEETLSSIGIKGTNYAVGGGSEVHLYMHEIKIDTDPKLYVTLYLSTSTALTKSDFIDYLVANGNIKPISDPNYVNNMTTYTTILRPSNSTPYSLYRDLKTITLNNGQYSTSSSSGSISEAFNDKVTQIF